MIPIKVSSLKSGDVYVLDGGTLQDNDRKYFGHVLSFFNEDDRETQNVQSITTNSFQTTTWDVAIGWLLGFHSYPEYDLSSSADLNQKFIELNNYTVNSSTNIVTLQGDSSLDLFLFKNLYIIHATHINMNSAY